MSLQLSISFNPVHQKENSLLNELHLEQFRDKFNEDCFNVLQELVKGKRLTVKGAMMEGLSNSLPRRILDLKQYGIPISTQWVKEHRYIEYYLSDSDKVKALEVLMMKMKAA